MRNNLSFASSLVLLQETENESDQSSVVNLKHYNADLAIDPIRGLEIFIKGTAKLHSLFSEIEPLLQIHHKGKKSPNAKIQEEAKRAYNQVTPKYLKMKEIIYEYQKGFSVGYDVTIQSYCELLFKTFDFINENLDMVYLIGEKAYSDDVKKYISKLEQLFVQFLDILKKAQSDKNKAEQIPNTDLQVKEKSLSMEQ